jgi:hypothetical protein
MPLEVRTAVGGYMARVTPGILSRRVKSLLKLCFSGPKFIHHAHHIVWRPQLSGNASSHRRRHAKRLVDAHKIVVHEIDRDSVGLVFDLLGEGIG